VSGFFICAFSDFREAEALASDVAARLGLVPGVSKGEVESFVGEFLNVIIGLTCAAWADRGLRVDFSPPEGLAEHRLDHPEDDGLSWQVRIGLADRYQAVLFLVFRPEASSPGA
jgi:hypothetical protein